MVNLSPIHYAKYPQNGERIVTIDSVTSFHLMYKLAMILVYLITLFPTV